MNPSPEGGSGAGLGNENTSMPVPGIQPPRSTVPPDPPHPPAFLMEPPVKVATKSPQIISVGLQILSRAEIWHLLFFFLPFSFDGKMPCPHHLESLATVSEANFPPKLNWEN